MIRAPGSLVVVSLSLCLDVARTHAAPGDSTPPVIHHTPIARARPGTALRIEARIEDSSIIFAPSVFVRKKGESEFAAIEMNGVASNYVATISGEVVTSDLEYFVEAFDEAGNGPSRVGSPQHPLRIRVVAAEDKTPEIPGVAPISPPGSALAPASASGSVPELTPPPPSVPQPTSATPRILPPSSTRSAEPKRSALDAWWLWTIVAVAAAGGSTAIYLATRPSTPDVVDVVVTGPDPRGSLP